MEIRAATGSSECLLGQTQPFPDFENAQQRKFDQLFSDNLCLCGSFPVFALRSRSLQCITYSQATQNLPPNLEEAWSMHTVKRNWERPTLLKFNDWLKDEAQTHGKMQLSSGKPRIEDSNPSANVIRTKTAARTFASNSSSQTPSMGDKADRWTTSCTACKEKHPLWRCPVLCEKTPTQRTKLVADNKLCFSRLNRQNFFRKWTAQVFKAKLSKHLLYLAPWFRKILSTKTPRKDWWNRGNYCEQYNCCPEQNRREARHAFCDEC